MKQLLIIGSVWPEPNSSAAGRRMLQLIEAFTNQEWQITFASAAAESIHAAPLTQNNLHIAHININDSSFDDFIKTLNPDVVLFDRFMTEEQFGWRVIDHCPNAIRILNTEDLHCLRKTREQCFTSKKEYNTSALLNNEITYRELASIYRCDLSLIISEYEMNLLHETFQISPSMIHYIPFLENKIDTKHKENWKAFEDRNHFITMGNFRHEPNWDSVLHLKQDIWPLIRKELPEAELHIYGAYPPPKATQLHDPKEGFIIKGWTENAEEAFLSSKVCLAPLRFGAGIKGKLNDAMLYGTPNVTTSIGAEGMLNDDGDWNGFVTDNPEKFAKAAIALYTNKSIWHQSQQNGIEIINTRFQKGFHTPKLFSAITTIENQLTTHRTTNFIGNMLNHHTMRSTKFLSKWIEEKNKSNT